MLLNRNFLLSDTIFLILAVINVNFYPFQGSYEIMKVGNIIIFIQSKYILLN